MKPMDQPTNSLLPRVLRLWRPVQWFLFAVILALTLLDLIEEGLTLRLVTLLFVPGIILTILALAGKIDPAVIGHWGSRINLWITLVIGVSLFAGAWVHPVFYFPAPLFMAWRIHKIARAIQRRLPWREDLRQNTDQRR